MVDYIKQDRGSQFFEKFLSEEVHTPKPSETTRRTPWNKKTNQEDQVIKLKKNEDTKHIKEVKNSKIKLEKAKRRKKSVNQQMKIDVNKNNTNFKTIVKKPKKEEDIFKEMYIPPNQKMKNLRSNQNNFHQLSQNTSNFGSFIGQKRLSNYTPTSIIKRKKGITTQRANQIPSGSDVSEEEIEIEKHEFFAEIETNRKTKMILKKKQTLPKLNFKSVEEVGKKLFILAYFNLLL